MVITLYAERRHPDIADVAYRLAQALAASEVKSWVALLAPHVAPDSEPGGESHVDRLGDHVPHDARAFLLTLDQRYAAVVVAVSGPPDERALATLDASHRVLIMSDPSVASLRATQRALRRCTSLGYGAEKVSVLLHGFADDAPLAPAEAAAALKRDIFGVIPPSSASAASRDEAYRALAQRLTASP